MCIFFAKPMTGISLKDKVVKEEAIAQREQVLLAREQYKQQPHVPIPQKVCMVHSEPNLTLLKIADSQDCKLEWKKIFIKRKEEEQLAMLH